MGAGVQADVDVGACSGGMAIAACSEDWGQYCSVCVCQVKGGGLKRSLKPAPMNHGCNITWLSSIRGAGYPATGAKIGVAGGNWSWASSVILGRWGGSCNVT